MKLTCKTTKFNWQRLNLSGSYLLITPGQLQIINLQYSMRKIKRHSTNQSAMLIIFCMVLFCFDHFRIYFSNSLCDFLRNSRKYWLGCHRKTPHGGHSSYRPKSLVRQSALTPPATTTTVKSLIKAWCCHLLPQNVSNTASNQSPTLFIFFVTLHSVAKLI